MNEKGPGFDRGVAALIEDLYDRGMSDDVMVVAMGEFQKESLKGWKRPRSSQKVILV